MKTILVTGSSKGIGYAMVKSLAAQGHQTILTGRTAEQVVTAQRELSQEGVKTDIYVLDILNEAQIKSAVEYVDKHYGKLDVLINNAGIFPNAGNSEFANLDVIRETIETNTLAPYRMIQAFLPLLKKSHDARIVNVSSKMASLSSMNGGAPGYRLSKTALNAVTKIFAHDLAPYGISVNSICPGFVKTQMGGPTATREPEEGADTACWLATCEKSPTGKFFHDRKEIAW